MALYYSNKFQLSTPVLIFLWFFSSSVIYSQSSSNLLNLAKNYEDDGLYEKAVPIYEDLYKKSPTNVVILDRLKNVYRILSKYDPLIQVISIQLQVDSTNVTLLCEFADVLYKSKKIPEAQIAIQKIINTDPASENNYRLVAAVLMSNRRFEEVEKIYLTARRNLSNDKLFILEMAGLLSYEGEYYLAAKEYLRYYRLNAGNLDYVRTQILQFPDNAKDNQWVIKAIQEDLAANKNDYALNRFLIELYFKNEEYELAFEESRLLDEKRGKNGAEILSFANLTFDNRLFSISQKAYSYFLNLYPAAPQAEMGIAKCYEGLGSNDLLMPVLSDSASLRQKINESFFSDKAIQAYQDLINKYPNSEWSAEAYFHIGEIRLRKFFDVQEAYRNFSKAVDSKGSYRIESMFRIAECYFVGGNLDKALAQYIAVTKETREVAIRDRALYHAAEVYFYLQQFDSCQRRMKEISMNQFGLFVNDALSYALLIQENQKDAELLKMYATSDFLFRRKKYSESLALFSEIIRSSPASGIVDDALMKIGNIYSLTGKHSDAITVYRNIVNDMKNSPLGDLALKKIGEIFDEKLGMPLEAVKAYKEVLIRYPKSIYGNQIRKRIRELEQTAKKSS